MIAQVSVEPPSAAAGASRCWATSVATGSFCSLLAAFSGCFSRSSSRLWSCESPVTSGTVRVPRGTSDPAGPAAGSRERG